MTKSAIYTGRVVHRRFRPRAHRLSYACYWFLLDLDEIETLAARLRHFSYNRFNLFALRDRDHGDGSGRPIKAQAVETLAKADIDIGGGRILLLTMPRVLGFCFNPLSVYYAFHPGGSLAAMIYEVHNTFGQRHSYVVEVKGETGCTASHASRKTFYVSPFLDMDLHYDFKTIVPDLAVHVTVTASDANGQMLKASLAGKARALSDASLRRLFLAFPLMTIKVVAAIHVEALKLWWKGVRLVPRPPPPDTAATVVKPPYPRLQETA